jgi:hypothetical protein
MYLKGFSTNGGLAVFDRFTGDIRRQTVENTAVEKHIYTFEDGHGRRRFEIEEMLSKIESQLSHAIPRFEKAEGYSIADIDCLLSFIAFAELRTPSALADAKRIKACFVDTLSQVMIESPERVANTLAAMYRERGENRNPDQLQADTGMLVKFIREREYDIVVHDQAALIDCIRLWKPLVDGLLRKDLLIIKPVDPDSRYITCDSPVVLESMVDGEIVGFGSDDAIVLFPLTSRCLISLRGNGSRVGVGLARPEQVERVNEMIAGSSDRYIMGDDETTLASLVERLELAKTTRAPKIHHG